MSNQPEASKAMQIMKNVGSETQAAGASWGKELKAVAGQVRTSVADSVNKQAKAEPKQAKPAGKGVVA